MEAITKIPVGSCVENKFQPRSRMRGIEALARNMKVNGQLTPITVVADGEAHQVVYGHRRLAAMKMNGEKWIDAIVTESWEDAVMARKLTAENCNRENLTAGEVGGSIQTMLQLGVPVTQVAASTDMDVTKVRDFARGAERVPDADATVSFDAIAAIGAHRDVLGDSDVEAIMAAENSWQVDDICRRARRRAAERELAAELEKQGYTVVGRGELAGRFMRRCEKGEGLVAVVGSSYDGTAYADFYREAEAIEADEGTDGGEGGGTIAENAPTPEEIEAEHRFEERREVARALDGHVAEFARSIYRKFPGHGHSKLRAWAHEAFAEAYGCSPDETWKGVKEQRTAAVDRFVLMRTVPQCLPGIPEGALRDNDLDYYEAEEAEKFLRFHAEVMAFARYRPTEEEAELFAHLRALLGADEDEAEAEGAGEAESGEQEEPRAECPAVELAERILAEAEAEPDAEPELAMAA